MGYLDTMLLVFASENSQSALVGSIWAPLALSTPLLATRESAFAGIHNTEKNSSLMSSLFVRLKRKKSTGNTLLKEQNFKQINQNEPRIHVQLENRTTHECWKRMPIFIKFKALKPDVPKEKRLNSADKLF